MILKQLLQGFCNVEGIPDMINVSGLSSDTRTLKSNDIFFAIPGINSDGSQYIEEAFNKAKAVIVDSNLDRGILNNIASNKSLKYQTITNIVLLDDKPVIFVEGLSFKIGQIAKKFYSNSIKYPKLIGVTGTNGKTSIVNFISQLFSRCGIKTASIGTVGYGFAEDLTSTTHTTSDCISTHKYIANLAKKGAKVIALEVSSHAIEQKRISGLEFETVIFTNLSLDHLDYHKTLDNYFAAKAKLFYEYNFKNAIVNIDCPYGQKLFKKLQSNQNNKTNYRLISYSLANIGADIYASNVSYSKEGIIANINSNFWSGLLETSLLGDFNLSNLLAVYTAAFTVNLDLNAINKATLTLNPAPGRMNYFYKENSPLVIVDYSHTPDALEKALKTLRPISKANLICVFGCGGNRDNSKRPEMLRSAEKYADKIIITNDNPRAEDPMDIIDDILEGNDNMLEVFRASESNHNPNNNPLIFVEPDRQKAIKYAILKASFEDVVLIAGKGHEDYQIVGDSRLKFSDTEQVKFHLSI